MPVIRPMIFFIKIGYDRDRQTTSETTGSEERDGKKSKVQFHRKGLILMQKNTFDKKALTAARIKLVKKYGFCFAGLCMAVLVVCLSVYLLARILFPVHTLIFFMIALGGTVAILLFSNSAAVERLDNYRRDRRMKRDIGKIVRDAYGYATDDNIDSINRLVSVIMKHSDKNFRSASKEYYNLISLGPAEMAVLYGDGYIRLPGRYHLRLPLTA